jgi:hypothetical protein
MIDNHKTVWDKSAPRTTCGDSRRGMGTAIPRIRCYNITLPSALQHLISLTNGWRSFYCFAPALQDDENNSHGVPARFTGNKHGQRCAHCDPDLETGHSPGTVRAPTSWTDLRCRRDGAEKTRLNPVATTLGPRGKGKRVYGAIALSLVRSLSVAC